MASGNPYEYTGTSPIGIPRPVREASSTTHDTIRGLVGSPDQISDFPAEEVSATPRSRNRFMKALGAPPQFQPHRSSSRNFSTPHASRNRSLSNTPRPGASSTRRVSDRNKEREWSIFEQLMSNERDGDPSSWKSDARIQRPLMIPSTPATHSRPSPQTERTQSFTQSFARSSHSSLRNGLTPQPEQPPQPASPDDSPLDDPFSDTESQVSESDDSQAQPENQPNSKSSWLPSLPTLTPLQRGILKCSVAYFIGSLFTFTPYLSGFISDITSYGPSDGDRVPSPSGHMVATVAVYYNPAKTMGAMLEADLFCLMGLLYVSFISLSCMSMFWFFEVQPGWEWFADALVLLWVGLAMSAVAWMKVWMAKPSFNTACSMIAIMIFIIVVKEGGLETLIQVATIVFIGAGVSNFVCYFLWPQRATQNLQSTMIQTLDSFSTLITMITQTFLLEEPVRQPSQEKLRLAVERHQASFTALQKNLIEAQSENWFGGPSRPSATRSRLSAGQAYEDAIDSLNRLGQHLNGLRSGTSLQFELIDANKKGKLVLPHKSKKRSHGTQSDGKGNDDTNGLEASSHSLSEDDIFLQAAADAFGELVRDLGPPLRSLSTTCATSLKRLREAFSLPNGRKVIMEPHDFQDLALAIERALFSFESTSNHAILRLYRTGTGTEPFQVPLNPSDGSVPGSDSENVFLVYFFIFTLQEFAKELISLTDAMSRICTIRRARAERRGLWNRITHSLMWLRTKLIRAKTYQGLGAQNKERGGLRKRFSAYFITQPAHKAVSFPKVKPHAPNTVQTPSRQDLTFMQRIKQSIWFLGARLKEQDLKYAIKAGMATAILAAPAFIESTRPIFIEYRGEWALISFFVVISPTIGATNFLGTHRVLGTLSGAATAAAIWTAFPENPYVLSIFGFFFSIPCFYYIVAKPQYATSARFVLLTYNLTCLYCYNLRQEDVSIIEIASHRFAAVTVGVVWAAIVSRYWWPAEARRELSKALGEFCLNVGWLYTRLVAFNSFDPDTGFPHMEASEDSNAPGEATSLLAPAPGSPLNESVVEFMAMELHLQIKLIELQGLLAQTQHEPRLKGPFPIKLYRSILTSLQSILDKLHSMRCVTSREEWHTTVRKEFIVPVNRERREMVGNVILYFSTLAAAFRLKSPLPPYLPPAEQARRRLVDAIRRLNVAKNRDVHGSRQLLFFAYALTMQGVIHELDYLGKTLQEAFGVIGGGTREFETLFGDRSLQAV